MLVVDLFQLCILIGQQQLFRELVIHTAQPEGVAFGITACEAPVLVVQCDRDPVCRVSIGLALEARTDEGQRIEFFAGEQAAFKGLREEAPSVGLNCREFWDQGAVFKLGLGQAHLASQAQATELISCATIIMGRQKAGTGSVRA
ncbi:hypothetical protein D9M71_639890 [compost metagenome]